MRVRQLDRACFLGSRRIRSGRAGGVSVTGGLGVAESLNPHWRHVMSQLLSIHSYSWRMFPPQRGHRCSVVGVEGVAIATSASPRAARCG